MDQVFLVSAIDDNIIYVHKDEAPEESFMSSSCVPGEAW